jgi:hypothetical protein
MASRTPFVAPYICFEVVCSISKTANLLSTLIVLKGGQEISALARRGGGGQPKGLKKIYYFA